MLLHILFYYVTPCFNNQKRSTTNDILTLYASNAKLNKF